MQTEIDAAHDRMTTAPEDEAARLAFYDRLADAELFVLLAREPSGDVVEPRIYDLEEGRFALAFDLEERLSLFAEGPAPYVALPGRVIARFLSEEGLGLGINLGVAPSAYLMAPATLAWLADTLDHMPEQARARPSGYCAPDGAPDALLRTLGAKLARLAGLAARAHLVQVSYEDGGSGLLLAFEGARAGAEPALAKAVSEALVFSGVEAGALDVTFLAAGDPALAPIAGYGLCLDLPEPAPEEVRVLHPAAPGMDPSRPPKLR